MWKYDQTRKLIFKDKFDGVIRGGAWAVRPSEETTERIAWSYGVRSASREFKITQNTVTDTPQLLSYFLKLSPSPEAGDYIELNTTYSSKYFNQIFRKAEGDQRSGNSIGHDCFDGVVPIQQIRQLKIQFRFPKSYPIDKTRISPCVAAYTSDIDYVIESEMKRVTYSLNDFGGNIAIDLSVENPILRCYYGIAWNAVIGND